MTAWITLIDPLSRLLDRIIPDPDARERAKTELRKAEQHHALEALRLALTADTAQTAINQNEATHRSLFIAGWRPFIGWVCGIAFAYHFLVQPFLIFVLTAGGNPVHLPSFDMDALFTVLMGLLGLGSLRTLEKIRNVTR